MRKKLLKFRRLDDFLKEYKGVWNFHWKKSRKRFKKNPHPLFEKIILRIKDLKNNPRPINCRKIVGSKSDYRIRIEDYRVIYEIVDKEKKIRIMRVKHRKEVYR